MNKFWKFTTILLAVVACLSILFGIYKFFDTKSKMTRLMPTVGTAALPQGSVNQYYEAQVSAVLVGIKRQVKLEVISIPSGLALKDCSMVYNLVSLPKPNSVVNCSIIGYPDFSGLQEVILRSSSKGFVNATRSEIPILVN